MTVSYTHLDVYKRQPIEGVNNISIPIQLHVVPRVGEKIYLSNKQVDNLISLLEEQYYHLSLIHI